MMPHEKIHDRHNRSAMPGEDEQPPQPFLEIGWSSGPTPLNDFEQPDGWVQVSANRDTTGARIPCDSSEYSELKTAEFLAQHPLTEVGRLTADQLAALAALLAGHMRYVWGEDVRQLGIQLDRDGVNQAIRTLRRARDRAYGADA